jgi:hypothetical protein
MIQPARWLVVAWCAAAIASPDVATLASSQAPWA